jgi:hypothetical protein
MTGKASGAYVPTYGDLWTFCDAERLNAVVLAEAYERDLSASPAPAPDSADFYRRRIVALRQTEARFVALARLVERYERSDAIKAEIKKMAEADRASRDGAVTAEVMPSGDEDQAE